VKFIKLTRSKAGKSYDLALRAEDIVSVSPSDDGDSSVVFLRNGERYFVAEHYQEILITLEGNK